MVFRQDAVDATAIVAAAQVELLLPLFGNPLRVFDDEPVHVGDPEAAVGSGADRDRPAPRVGGREEFRLLLFLGALADERVAVPADDLAQDHVVHRFADEGVAFDRQEFGAVDHRSAGGGDALEVVVVVEALERVARWEKLQAPAGADEVHGRGWRDDVGIALEVMVGEHEMPHRRRVVATEPVPPVVAVATVLRAPRLRLQRSSVGPDAQIPPADIDFLAGLHRFDHAIAVAVRDVNPLIEPPAQTVGAVLLVALTKTAVEHFAVLGDTIAIAVFRIDQIRRGEDKHAGAPGHHACRIRQPVEEHD